MKREYDFSKAGRGKLYRPGAKLNIPIYLDESVLGYSKLPLVLRPQPEGGFTVTSPLFPELLTEGVTIHEALENVQDALAAVIELYQDLGRPLPAGIVP